MLKNIENMAILTDAVAILIEIIILVIIKRHVDKLKEQREKMDEFLMKLGEQSEILYDHIEKLEEQTPQENALMKEKED